MPHIIVEYSANIEPACSASALLDCIHQAAIGTGIFEPDAVRTRAAPRTLYRVGNGKDETAGFILIMARIRPGRQQETQEALLRELMRATEHYLLAVKYARPLMVNVEIHELPPRRVGAKLPR